MTAISWTIVICSMLLAAYIFYFDPDNIPPKT